MARGRGNRGGGEVTDLHETDIAAGLAKLHACADAVKWVKGFSDPQTAWNACDRGDWMLWILGKLAGPPMSDSRRPLALAACECARLALPHVAKGEDRPLVAIELTERWARGDDGVTRNVLSAAAAAADAASADAADAASAAFAADAAADAASAAYAAAAAASARPTALKACAEIVRKHFPKAPSLIYAAKAREAGKCD